LNNIKNQKASINSIKYLLSYGADVNAIGGITDIREKGINISEGSKFTGVSVASKIERGFLEASPTMPEGTAMQLEIIEYDRKIGSAEDKEAQKILQLAGGKYLYCKRDKENRFCRLTFIAPPLSQGTTP
jgi:hypothetical protein